MAARLWSTTTPGTSEQVVGRARFELATNGLKGHFPQQRARIYTDFSFVRVCLFSFVLTVGEATSKPSLSRAALCAG